MKPQPIRPSQMFRAARPAQMAREALGSCLGDLQDVPGLPAAVEELTRCVASATQSLFRVEKTEPEDPAHAIGVRRAAEDVRRGLEILQELDTKVPAVVRSAQTLARVVAILYPIARAAERVSLPPIPAPEPRPVAPHPARKTVRLQLTVDIGFQSDTNFYLGFSEDLSEGGLFVATYDYQPLGSKLFVSFTLPGGHAVAVAGEVRWVREYNPAQPDLTPGMGVQFQGLSGEDRAAIERFLGRRAPLFFEQA